MKNELLPFNLEEALKNPERVVYRNGEKPFEWHWFEHMPDEACIISVRKGSYWSHNKTGFYNNDESGCSVDLMLLAENRYYINVYDNGKIWKGFDCSHVFDSENSAKIFIEPNKTFIKTISFTI